ncbi:dienelactone hydrolase endo-1-3,1,4-beta-D-glucanase [Cylindrobasidium torrendii FP15055 ss-10]|uniref:Dienelactone hydrolase endo-1-3,1,4-beta-D-glucanase n=1 Tax=Cylindrobasidium torrendii FP15055 ss-10 TaxID=1314674 RepID=A0A0D7B2Z8_9AGAR|nr:dienelactone hydrolase endo-1-3,1,4-beta-D-glucanase [Cylindrobasidium torrendii FP15055 ss-10]
MSCPSCFKGIALTETPKGTVDAELDGAYVASGNGASNRAVIVFTDIFGLFLPNTKIFADNYAEQLGCDVYVPDLFAGKPPVQPKDMELPERAGEKLGFLGWVKFIIHLLPYIPAMYSQRPTVTDIRVKQFLDKLQAKKAYEKLGAVGFCYGGSTVVRLGATTDIFSTLVICHPGKHAKEEFAAIKVPCSWGCAEDDMGFNDKIRMEAEAEFAGRRGKTNEVPYEFKVYPGTTHGFAARPNLSIPEVKDAFEGVQQQIVDWLKKTLIEI